MKVRKTRQLHLSLLGEGYTLHAHSFKAFIYVCKCQQCHPQQLQADKCKEQNNNIRKRCLLLLKFRK
ncbi:Hypothetical predicted protein [Octopus vulgaris]|uniref:Uncharacterized protein n=1 Tax=Octopus vulgaris TaxID=6645 RepID=A0AA36FCZ5_OCTVU|nr:Hypothetical predicted protein [Octopus vulgaris]